eukprot:scaffold250589_cov17-Prasinocladus_malaysianus.AAC.1
MIQIQPTGRGAPTTLLSEALPAWLIARISCILTAGGVQSSTCTRSQCIHTNAGYSTLNYTHHQWEHRYK